MRKMRFIIFAFTIVTLKVCVSNENGAKIDCCTTANFTLEPACSETQGCLKCDFNSTFNKTSQLGNRMNCYSYSCAHRVRNPDQMRCKKLDKKTEIVECCGNTGRKSPNCSSANGCNLCMFQSAIEKTKVNGRTTCYIYKCHRNYDVQSSLLCH